MLLLRILIITILACSSDGVLELEPMDAYNRLLLHRLAEIFGYFLKKISCLLCDLYYFLDVDVDVEGHLN